MTEFNKEHDQKNSRNRDPFDQLMFGQSNSENLKELKVSDSQDSEKILHDPWSFNMGRKEHRERVETYDENNKVDMLLNNIDLDQLMKTIDTLMNSAHQLKPLFKKVAPFIEQFLKK